MFCPLGKLWILVVATRPSKIMMRQCFCSSEPKHLEHHGQTFFGKKMRFHQLPLISIISTYEFANLGISPQFDVQDPIFITEGIEIEEETDGSTLTVHNLQLEDQVFKMDLYLYGFLVRILFLSEWNLIDRDWSNVLPSTTWERLSRALNFACSVFRDLQVSSLFCVLCFMFCLQVSSFFCIFVFCVLCSEICKWVLFCCALCFVFCVPRFASEWSFKMGIWTTS